MSDDGERWLPVKRACPRELFTDREWELKRLDKWEDVARRGSRAAALLSPRRMGKTAILMHFYEHLFWEQEELAPFYFEVPKEGLLYRELATTYAFEFMRQYLCFILRDRRLGAGGEANIESLEPYVRQVGGDLLEIHWPGFLEAMSRSDDRTLWNTAREMVYWVNEYCRPQVVTIIDEFQWLDDRVFRDAEKTKTCRDLTGSYFSIASAYNSNLIVAGSALTIMARDVLGGGMNGRFTPWPLGPLPPEAALELALKCSAHYGTATNLECAELICRTAQYNPYYNEVVFREVIPDCDLTTPEGVKAAYQYEVTAGEIRQFWLDHFGDTARLINDDQIGKKLIFAILKWEDEHTEEEKLDKTGLRTREIAEMFGLDFWAAHEKAQTLCRADVIRNSGVADSYCGMKDEMLAQCLRIAFRSEIEDIKQREVNQDVIERLHRRISGLEKEKRSLRGALSNMLGAHAEFLIAYLMKHYFRGQRVDAARFFSRSGQVLLPRFSDVGPLTFQPIGDRRHQVDNVGVPAGQDDPHWLTEQKNWKDSVPADEVTSFCEAVEAYRREREDTPTVAWLYAKNGLTDEARQLADEKGLFISTAEEVEALIDELGLAQTGPTGTPATITPQ